MKSILLVTAASALVLSACAGMQASSSGAAGATASAPGAGTLYCWKRSLEEAGGTLTCNWETSTREACRSISRVPLAKGAVASGPRDAGRCDNGEWLVAVATR